MTKPCKECGRVGLDKDKVFKCIVEASKEPFKSWSPFYGMRQHLAKAISSTFSTKPKVDIDHFLEDFDEEFNEPIYPDATNKKPFVFAETKDIHMFIRKQLEKIGGEHE